MFQESGKKMIIFVSNADGLCCSVGAVRRRPALRGSSAKKPRIPRIRPDHDFPAHQDQPGAPGRIGSAPNHPRIQHRASDHVGHRDIEQILTPLQRWLQLPAVVFLTWRPALSFATVSHTPAANFFRWLPCSACYNCRQFFLVTGGRFTSLW